MNKNRGFTLIELMLVISIMMGLALLELQKMKVSSDDAVAQQAGREFGVVIDAMQTFLDKHMAEYQDMASLPSGCSAVDANTCALDMTVFIREGLVPSGWQPTNRAIRTDYVAYIRRVPPAAGAVNNTGYNIEGMIRTVNPWNFGGGIEYSLLGSAVRHAGPNAGLVRSGVAVGLFGAWSMPVGRYPGLDDGQMVGVVKVQASTINQYVRLDGSLPMTGNLDMGNNRVNNANDMQLLGQVSLPRQGGTTTPMVSNLMPKYVLKAVYNVSDYDSDNVLGTVKQPVCPDTDPNDLTSGVPRILVKMSTLYNEMYGGSAGGEPAQNNESQDSMLSKTSPAFGGWNFYALEDQSTKSWRVYVRRFYDNGYIPGEALAEVYCYYP
jgi:prepilin-type N-terminal cleavage/methylation domain-containing protein